MYLKTRSYCFFLINCGLVLIIDSGLTFSIEGQLTTIKNDCYERMAVGEKLSPKQIYKTFEHKTVSKCEMECTQEKERCRAFSFGIGVKGNATCHLSKNPIKETADLKPIGTTSDTDYDLYIKKMDCQLVIENPQHQGSQKPPETPIIHTHTEPEDHDSQQADHHGYGVHGSHFGDDSYDKHCSEQNGAYGNLPSTSNYYSLVSKPSTEIGYHYNRPTSNHHKKPPLNIDPEGLHHVQTLVSIASGPQSVLHPVHDILVAGDSFEQEKPMQRPVSNGYGDDGNMPPFRPSALHHPYDEHRPLPSDNTRPDPEYESRPPLNRPAESGHGLLSNNRPYYFDHDRPDPDYGPRPTKYGSDFGYGGEQHSIDRRKYQSFSQFDSFESEAHRYGNEQSTGYRPEYNHYDHYEKPNQYLPDRYGSIIPHPNDYNKPNLYNDYLFVRPNSGSYYDDRSPRPRPEYGLPKPIDTGDRPQNPPYDRPFVKPTSSNDYESSRPRPGYDVPKPLGSGGQNHGPYDPPATKPYRPNYDQQKPNLYDRPVQSDSTKRPASSSSLRPISNLYGGLDYTNKQYGKPGEYYGTQKPHNFKGDHDSKQIVSQSVGYNGETITSIITELKDACFRRTLAGKRVVRGLVRRLLVCDTVEQCQHECGDEKLFTCEGFNYRLDPTGRGKGDCELLGLPLSRIDIPREILSDPDYDFYTRDRNAAQVHCRQRPSNSYVPYDDYRGGNSYRGGGGSSYNPGRGGYRYGYGGSQGYDDREYDIRGDGGRPFDRRPTDIARPLRRPGDRWDEDSSRERRPPRPDLDRRPGPGPESDRRHEYGNRRGDSSYHHSHESHSSHSYHEHYNEHNSDRYNFHEDHRPYTGIHYLPASRRPYNDPPPRPYEPPVPPKRYPERRPLDRYPEKDYWGLNRHGWGSYGGSYGNFGDSDLYNGYGEKYYDRSRYDTARRNHYIPPKLETPKDWGLYGGSYGNGGLSLEYQGYGNKHSYNYWGFNKYDDNRIYESDLLPPKRNPIGYLPADKHPPLYGEYEPIAPRPGGEHYLPSKPGGYDLDNNVLPAKPRRPPSFDLIRDECSLRSATGFRLHKGIVKKFYAVPNIYECELLCVREKDFPCASYAFRYTISQSKPADNCYLSNRNYKELDYYTDIEPDRDFDIYTMNNRNRCEEPVVFLERDNSDCFWRVRSGQRLDHTVVRDSLSVRSIVDCQIECLKSRRFTCRAYSFRYGSPVIGGAIDNCQLTDWPFYELDPRIHFIPEPGFEVYERGSFGHGCEPDHFGIRGKHVNRESGIKVDQLCYVGFGSASRLLPQATIKSVYVPTELDCKVECSKAREGTLFRCMSFSFSTGGSKVGHNCFLSDIMQRDLLPNVDYAHDPDSWLFAWDNYNPECVDLAFKPIHNGILDGNRKIEDKYGLDFPNALDTWRIYSVSGWPCRRGTKCKENRVGGFWFCELEGGEKNAWDYCCRPDHQCGISNGYPYSWCYVGSARTQWRKCSDQYYPYNHHFVDRLDGDRHYLPKPLRPSHLSLDLATPELHRPGYRPDRPPAPPRPIPPRPSLDEYEQEFDNEFLSPPKPGGFGQPRRWPVSYLHKEMPPNDTLLATIDTRIMRTEKTDNPKLSAIKSLINVIKNNDFQNVQYHISNDSNKPDDILYVKIPLPNFLNKSETNTANEKTSNNELTSKTNINFEIVDSAHMQSARVQKSLPFNKLVSQDFVGNQVRSPVFRRGFVTRTNVSSIRRYREEEFES